MRAGIYENKNIASKVIENCVNKWNEPTIGLVSIHGRSREQRYTKSADWDYPNHCSTLSNNVPVFASGDVFSFHDYQSKLSKYNNLSGIMIGRGALINPGYLLRSKNEETGTYLLVKDLIY